MNRLREAVRRWLGISELQTMVDMVDRRTSRLLDGHGKCSQGQHLEVLKIYEELDPFIYMAVWKCARCGAEKSVQMPNLNTINQKTHVS
jgi:hypothetical protein